MKNAELVWVKYCEVSGRELKRLEYCPAEDFADLVQRTKAFESRCERWYAYHVKTIVDQRSLIFAA